MLFVTCGPNCGTVTYVPAIDLEGGVGGGDDDDDDDDDDDGGGRDDHVETNAASSSSTTTSTPSNSLEKRTHISSCHPEHTSTPCSTWGAR